MAELNLKQIIDRLNEEFTGDTRKLVYWYNEKWILQRILISVELAKAKILKLESGNPFATKYFLECQNMTK